jgi:hypothetical protein
MDTSDHGFLGDIKDSAKIAKNAGVSMKDVKALKDGANLIKSVGDTEALKQSTFQGQTDAGKILPDVSGMTGKLGALSSGVTDKLGDMPSGLGSQASGLVSGLGGKMGSLMGSNGIPLNPDLMPSQPVNFLKFIRELVVACVIIFFVVIVVYVIYIILKYYYPRPWFISHSEPFEPYVQEYVMDIANTLLEMRDNFLNTESSDNVKTPFFPVKISSDKEPLSFNDATPQNMPIFFTFLMFGEAIIAKDYNELFLIEKLFEDNENDYTWNLLEVAKTKKEVPEWAQTDMKAFKAFYDTWGTTYESIEKSTKGAKGPDGIAKKIGSFTFSQIRMALMAKYLKQIRKMYDFRKGGGKGNLKMFKLVMGDYTDYIWGPSKNDLEKQGEKGVVPEIWVNYLPDVIAAAQSYEKIVAGPKVSSFMASLPAKIGGVESFVDMNTPDKNPIEFLRSFLPPPMAKPGDKVETLGFLKPLIEIPKFFKVLMDVAKGLAKAVASPLKFLRMLIGIIVGTSLYIMYIVIVAISPIFYIPAVVVETFVKIGKSFFWVFFYLVIALFVVILWILDFFLGGFILSLFRCENLPDAWLRVPGFLFGNKYKRITMCNFRCGSRYMPDDSWCARIPNIRPTYCPQQLIIMGTEALLQDKDLPSEPSPLRDRLLTHNFTPSPKYYTLTSLEKKAVIKEWLSDKYDFLGKCFDKLNSQQKALSISACFYVHKLRTEATPEKPLSSQSRALLEKLSSLCSETYCKNEYKSASGVMKVLLHQKYMVAPRKNPDKTGISFCDVNVKELEQAGDATTDEPIMYKLVYTALITTVVIVVFHTIYKYAIDKKFNFTSPLPKT